MRCIPWTLDSAVLMEHQEHDLDSLVPTSNDSFDIVHGVNVEDPTQPLLLYWNRKGALAEVDKQKKYFWISMAIVVAIIFIPMIGIVLQESYSDPATPFIFIAFIVGFAAFTIGFCWLAYRSGHNSARRDLTEDLNPVVAMRPEGLSIHCPLMTYENIPWEEIKEVKSFTYNGYKCVGIIPVNLERTLKHAVKDDSRTAKKLKFMLMGTKNLARINSLYQRWYGLFGVQFAPILVPEIWLPLEAAEVAELINARRMHALGLPYSDKLLE